MKAIKCTKPWDVSLVDVPSPKQEGLAIIKVHAAGICGSDIGAFRGTNNLVTYPRIIGHELTGEIIYLPEENPKGFKVGDKVVVDPYLYCGRCYPCSIGRMNCCDELRVLGVHVDGGMSEYFAHPANMLVALPDGVRWEHGALAEPLTISLHSVHRAELKAGEHFLIFGAGPIGILAGFVAKAYGAIPIMVDPVDERLGKIRELGIKNTINPIKEDIDAKVKVYCEGRKVEAVMEASGSNAAIRNTLDCVSNAGRIVLTGWPKLDTSLPTGLFTKKELDVRGARNSANEFDEALSLIKSGKIPIEKIITKVISIDEVPDTIIDIEKNPGNYLKVVVKMY